MQQKEKPAAAEELATPVKANPLEAFGSLFGSAKATPPSPCACCSRSSCSRAAASCRWSLCSRSRHSTSRCSCSRNPRRRSSSRATSLSLSLLPASFRARAFSAAAAPVPSPAAAPQPPPRAASARRLDPLPRGRGRLPEHRGPLPLLALVCEDHRHGLGRGLLPLHHLTDGRMSRGGGHPPLRG